MAQGRMGGIMGTDLSEIRRTGRGPGAATHRTVHLTGIDILRIADGRVVERWGEADGNALRQQIAPA